MTRSKKVTAMLAALVLMVSLAVPALALGDVDLTLPGSITLTVPESTEYWSDLEEQDVPVTVLVYKLADVNEHGAFTPMERFTSLAESPAWNGGILNDYTPLDALIDAARAVLYPADAAPAEGVDTSDALYEPEPVFEPTFTQQIDPVSDTISVPEVGLYLLLPQKMQTTQWVYTYNPLLVAVPSIERDTTPEEGGLPAEGEWQYEVPAQLKPERVRRLTELEIVKTLQEYNTTLGGTTFLFDVQADIDPEGNVFSQLVPLTFAGTGTQSVTVSGIPVGAHVTVTEVYSGASYEAVNGQVNIDWLPLPDELNGMQRVEFTNLYTDRQNPDTSLVNTWVREGEGWTWQSGEEAG